MKKLLSTQERNQVALDKVVLKSNRFYKLFTSPIGAEVLKDLEDQFDPDVLIGATDSQTNYKVGGRDVIVYIRQMLRLQINANRAEELE